MTASVDVRTLYTARDEAHRRAARGTANRLGDVMAHLSEQNYGLARDAIAELLTTLPHDHGAQEFYPAFDEHLERLLAAKT